jgi:sugar O-acyltransferase (sialic acid O-acetyltransferase NeuD family)
MSSLLVVGAGGHGRVVADAAISTGQWNTLAFLDDCRDRVGSPLGFEVIGGLADLERVGYRFDGVALGLGNSRLRLSLYVRCQQLDCRLPVITHRSAVVSPYARIGPATVVLAQAVINPGARLGIACILNTGATVDHDCEIGDGVHISPGANLAGNVTVGRATWIGIGASVREGTSIGHDVTVGAGSVVVANVESSLTVFGVPAKVRT